MCLGITQRIHIYASFRNDAAVTLEMATNAERIPI